MNCSIWVYGPQMSITDNSYAIGGSTWSSAFNTSVKNESEIYGSVTPSLLHTTSTMYQGTPENIIRLVKPVLIDCKVFSDILLIHSAFINALGFLYQQKNNIKNLETAFTEVYNITKEMVGYGNMYRFVSPENFPKLNIRATQIVK